MVFAASNRLQANVQRVNELNVFPVPDGDTGTNMNLTLSSGVDELKQRSSPHIATTAEVLAKGLLMGARGNSGVILSQLFRGFAKGVYALEEVNALQFAQALQQGVEMAYAAVVRPVEGTILTVSKEAAKAAQLSAKRNHEIDIVMRDTLLAAKEALARTPDLLPVLKQVGVVDSGGQGLIHVYEGFYEALSGEWDVGEFVNPLENTNDEMKQHAGQTNAVPVQAHFGSGEIEHGYCTEFIVRLDPLAKAKGLHFDELQFTQRMETLGDSLLVVADDELVKIHIHAELPGEVMTYAMQYGDLIRIKIENMREQHSHIITQTISASNAPQPPLKPYAMIAVAAGDGIAEIFRSLGVDHVLAGGQTMNPSAEEILNAIHGVHAQTVFVLPNNSNIILTAGQARELSDKSVIVLPTKSIQQGIAAVLAFQLSAEPERNASMMEQAMKRVQSGQVTQAIRDSKMDGIHIREGDHIGIMDGKIVASNNDVFATCQQLVQAMVLNGDEILSVFIGGAAEPEVTEHLQQWIASTYPTAEVEFLPGGQPVYTYLFSVE
jgi:DAK2 domain fusion protein YloV